MASTTSQPEQCVNLCLQEWVRLASQADDCVCSKGVPVSRGCQDCQEGHHVEAALVPCCCLADGVGAAADLYTVLPS